MSNFNMERIGLNVTLVCNLNCALCSNYAPYYKNQKHFSVDDLKKSIDRYFSIVTHVKKFIISGGEPLLHPRLNEIIEVLNKYNSRMDVLEIITNGTIVPNDGLLRSLKKFGEKAYLLIDNYGDCLSTRIASIVIALEENGTRFVVRDNNANNAHCSGWVDYGDLTIKKGKTDDLTKQIYKKCAHPSKLKFCFGIVDGVMYPCTVYRRCKELGSISDNYSEYIDLYDDSLTIEEQRNKISKIYSGDMLSACAFCEGLCDDSKRFTPAIQLTDFEKNKVRLGARFYAETK